MLRLLLARHGESEWQVRGNEAGSNSQLTELGRHQADRLGQWLAGNLHIDHIYTSPLHRARETAERVAAHLHLPITVRDDLQEAWFFISEELPAYSKPTDVLDGISPDGRPGAKNYRWFRVQVSKALRDILNHHQEGTILIVAHGGTLETIIRLLLNSDTFTVNIGNTTLHSLVWYIDRWHIDYIDRWEHLREG